MLAGTVNVVYTAATDLLEITGDIDPNEVVLRAGQNLGDYTIEGVDTTINGPTSIEDPVTRIVVNLGGGSDSFRIESSNPNNKVVVTAEVEIQNEDGANVNKLINARINDDLTVRKITGSSESTLEIIGTTIVGVTTVNNFDGGQGASKTKITSSGSGESAVQSHLQDDLIITNGAGQDILNIYQSRIDGDVTVDNGDGDTRTVLGQTLQDPVIYGNFELTNGDGNDENILHDTHVWGHVLIENELGQAHTEIEDSSVGLGAPVGNDGDLTVNSDSGYDEVRLVNTTVRDDFIINNDINGVAASEYGSNVEIMGNSRIGNDFRFTGDNGWDHVKFQESRVVDDAFLYLNNGGSSVEFVGTAERFAVVGERLTIEAEDGSDEIRLERTTVEGDTEIDLGDGVDLLEIVRASMLLGSSSFTSGDKIDVFRQQILPPAEAVDIVFIDFDDFNVHEYLTS
ncbi:MAG: hypothetical protein GXY83_39105 [Rhodopirellula sp.]|nr:hypothetical protein [Rhodopirellula sp.]